MNLKEKILLIDNGAKEEREMNLLAIKKEIAGNNYSIDFEREISELTEDDYYHLGRALSLLDFSHPYFPTALAEEAKVRIGEIGKIIGLKYILPQDFEKINYFNMFNLIGEGYEFANDAKSTNHNQEILQSCLNTFYVNSGLSKSLKTRPKSSDFELTNFRSAENLLMLYTERNNNQNVFYCLTNTFSPTYKMLNG